MAFGEKPPERKKEEGGEARMSRRAFLAGLGAAAALGGSGAEAAGRRRRAPHESRQEAAGRPPGASATPEELARYSFLRAEKHPRFVDAGPIAGRKFHGLFADLLGTDPGVPVPQRYGGDPKYQLALLWQKKLPLVDAVFQNAKREHNPKARARLEGQAVDLRREVLETAERLYRVYDPERARQQPLSEYLREADGVIAVARSAVAERWSEIGRSRGLSSEGLALARALERHLGGRTLFSYALTELMPSEDGGRNALVFDFLLGHAGAEYVESIPSLHDALVSFGPYQITDAALASPDGGSGAARMNREFGFPVPHSMAELSGSLHHTTAYALGIESCIAAARIAPRVPGGVLTEFESDAEGVAAFLGVAHHAPEGAAQALRQYLAQREAHARRPHAHKHAPQTFAASIRDASLAQYARKTVANYRALGSPELVASN